MIIVNRGPDPKLVSQIRGFEEGHGSIRETIGRVRNVHYLSGELAFEGVVSFPLRIEHHDTARVWTVIEAEVPERLGRELGELYGIDGIVLGENSRRIIKNLKECEQYVLDRAVPDAKVLGIVLQDFRIPEVKISNPIVNIDRGESLSVNRTLSTLPDSFYHDLFQRVAERHTNLTSIEASPHSSYVIEIVLEDGQTVRKVGKINSALWFMHPDRAFS